MKKESSDELQKEEEKPSNDLQKEKKRLFATLMEKDEEMLTSAEVMQLFNISRKSFYRWRVSRVLPCMKMGGTYYYSKSVLSNILAQKMVKKP